MPSLAQLGLLCLALHGCMALTVPPSRMCVRCVSQDEWLSESRKLVTVFMRIVGLGGRLCEVRSLDTLDKVVRLVQSLTNRYGGQVTRLICDDKVRRMRAEAISEREPTANASPRPCLSLHPRRGIAEPHGTSLCARVWQGVRFLIGFGMPGRAHEDDESRAVVSSLQIQQAVAAYANYDGSANLACAIGITSGTVFCGEAGSERRREYTINGGCRRTHPPQSCAVMRVAHTSSWRAFAACACQVRASTSPRG